MDPKTFSLIVLSSLLFSVPRLVADAIGLWFAVSRRPKHPAVSSMVIGGLTLNVIATLAGSVSHALPLLLRDSNYAIREIGMITGVASAVLTVVSTVGYALVLVAVFMRRGPETKPVPAASVQPA